MICASSRLTGPVNWPRAHGKHMHLSKLPNSSALSLLPSLLGPSHSWVILAWIYFFQGTEPWLAPQIQGPEPWLAPQIQGTEPWLAPQIQRLAWHVGNAGQTGASADPGKPAFYLINL